MNLGFFKEKWKVLIRLSIIGYIIGVIPGAGATIASMVSYNEAKRWSKEKDSFAKGNPEGTMASEAANISSVSGAMAPLLALGIPGSACTAIMIGALTIQGIQPGPLLFTKNPEIPYFILTLLTPLIRGIRQKTKAPSSWSFTLPEI